MAIYLDYAAATPMEPQVVAAMQPYLTEKFQNPSALYLSGKGIAQDVTRSREQVAHWLGSRPGEVIFTAGGTEANNLAIHGVMRSFSGKNLIVSAIEHDSVLKPAARHQIKICPVLPNGLLDVMKLESMIDDDTVLISVMYANNEVGTVQPLKRIAECVNRIRQARKDQSNTTPLLLHTDACQAPNYLDIHVGRLGVDLMTLNGGKIYGPKQSGALYVRAGIQLTPLVDGGGQERGLRSGTEPVAQIIGFATALDIAQQMRSEEAKRIAVLQAEFIKQLKDKLPNSRLNGSSSSRIANNVHITIEDQDNEWLLMLLDELGVECAVGSACSASNDEPSHVLRAMGLSDRDARASLRFSLGRQTTKQDIDTCMQLLVKAVHS